MTITAITEGLISKRDLTYEERMDAVQLEKRANEIIADGLFVRCEECPAKKDECYACSGTGKQLDDHVSHSLYSLELAMYGIDDIYGDYITMEIKKVINA